MSKSPTSSRSKPTESVLAPSAVERLAQELKEARANNRQIIPIVGAGLSADCGFPIVTVIVRYFGKLYRYIKYSGPIKDSVAVSFVKERFETYRKEPWRFIEDFGWPDRFQLNQDLFTQIVHEARAESPPQLIEAAVREGLKDLLPNLNPQGFKNYDSLREDIAKAFPLVVQSHGDRLALEAYAKAREKALDRFLEDWSRSTPFDVLGDWRSLILYFTNFHSDYADALFARFGATRRPGQGHQFLAFLARHLSVPTIFTFNFDSLIEQALEAEGTRVRVFAMEHGAGLPHASLLRGNQLSVIKMHGSTHALLVDEQLDRPLIPAYLERFDLITGENPLLLVVGCSENDRRLRDLVSHAVKESIRFDESKRNRESKPHHKAKPCVLWLHYEDESPKFLDELARDARKAQKILVCPTNNPGATLLHFHSSLSNCNPPSRVPYLAHVQPPVHLGRNREKTWPDKTRFELISSGEQGNPMPTAAHVLIERANYWARHGYHFIWIDLEAVQTLAGVVGSIIDQCRKFDPDLAPSVLPLDIERGAPGYVDSTLELAATRVARALRRTRYYVAFDGLKTFAYPATTHHGLTHMVITEGADEHLRNLVNFLLKLIGMDQKDLKHKRGHSIGESLIAVSVDGPKPRYDEIGPRARLADSIPLDEQCKRLVEGGYEDQRIKPWNEPGYRFEQTFKQLRDDLPLVTFKTIEPSVSAVLKLKRFCEPADSQFECNARLALVLLNLSFFRRTRPLVAMRHLLEPLLISGDASDKTYIDKLLVAFSREPQDDDKPKYALLTQLEGGGFWFNHTIRDYIYAQNTRYTNTEQIRECLTPDQTSTPEARSTLCQNVAFQLFLADMTHQRIARTWYTRTFVQSQDTFAFLEYTYHQISSIRSLVRLRGLVQVAITNLSEKNEEGMAQAVLKGIAKCDELIQSVNEELEETDIFRKLEFEGSQEFPDKFFTRPNRADEKERPLREKIDEVESSLAERHERELHTLYRAWTRAEVILRTQVAAEQLLHWCSQLLEDDLKHRCNRVVIDYEIISEREGKSTAPSYKPIYYDAFSAREFLDKDLEDGLIAKFRRYLRDLRVKLWIERSDYETCIKERQQQLASEDRPDEESLAKKILDCHQLLDIADSSLKWEQEQSFDDDELIEGRQKALDTLSEIEETLKSLEDELENQKPEMGDTNLTDPAADFPQAQANLNEAWLRLLHLRAECQLGRVSMFSHNGFTGDAGKNKWVPKVVQLEAAKKTIRDGLLQISARDARTRYTPRSVIVDPTADGALYLQYRSVFYLLNGRARWLDRQRDHEKAFEAALWSFEMARGGLGSHGPLISALIELYTVEALLARSRAVLYGGKIENGTERVESWYRSARGGLHRANELLLAGRRNVIWRKFYFRLATQYQSDRLLLNYTLLENKREERKSQEDSLANNNQPRAKTLRTRDRDQLEHQLFWNETSRKSLIGLRRGYQNLVTALDLYLPSPERKAGLPTRYRWLYRMWWELTLCGYAIGRLAIDELGKPRDKNHAHRHVREQLKWLNEIDGIEDSVLGEFVKDKNEYELLKKHFDELQAVSGTTGIAAALCRRRKIILLALEKRAPAG